MYSIEWLTRKRAEKEAADRAAGRGRFSVYANPHHPGPSPVGERFSRTGEVLVTPQQHALLWALRARDDLAFPSVRAWVEAAAAGESPFHATGLRRCVPRLPRVWVARIPQGRRRLCTLQARGRAIVDGEIPARILGRGPIDWPAPDGTAPTGTAPPQTAPSTGPAPARAPGTARPAPGAGPDAARAPEPLREPQPSLGQLLEGIDHIVEQLEQLYAGEERVDEGVSEAVARLERRLVDHEVDLSARRAWLETDQEEIGRAFLLLICRNAVDACDLQRFVENVDEADLSMIGDLAREALRFPFWWRQYAALEEVVLVGEARVLGLEEASRRRLELHEQALLDLMGRVAAIVPSPGEEQPY